MVSLNLGWLRKTVRIFEGKEPLKQVIVVRADLKMSPGKLAAQVAHGSVSSFFKMEHHFGELAKVWIKEGMKKVVLSVGTLEELKAVEKKAKELELISVMVRDAGRTELASGEITCVGIGPDSSSKIDKVTGSLPLLK